jgi:hypothetical protein
LCPNFHLVLLLSSSLPLPFSSLRRLAQKANTPCYSSTPAKILRDGPPEIFDIRTRNSPKIRLFGVLRPLLEAMSHSGGSTKARVTRDLDQISTSTQRCMTRDCRFDRNSTVWSLVTSRRPLNWNRVEGSSNAGECQWARSCLLDRTEGDLP